MSNPRVTITLGRTGQVVERGGTLSNVARGYDGGPISGGKRSMGEGLGSSSNGFLLPTNKRRRDDGFRSAMGDNTCHDPRISQYDLRLKLMRKNPSKQTQGVHEEHKRMDLRSKLSKPVQQAPLSHSMLQYKSEMKGGNLYRKIPPRESADDLHLVDSLNNSYSSRATNGMRARSTERNLRTSSHCSPPRNFDGMWKMSSLRGPAASRAGQFSNIGVVNVPRPTGAIPMTMKPTPEAVRQVSHGPPASCSMQPNIHMVEPPITVAGLLHTLGLGKYTVLFQAEEVDMTALRQMGDKDLKELGIPMGPRKKILLALLPRAKRQPP